MKIYIIPYNYVTMITIKHEEYYQRRKLQISNIKDHFPMPEKSYKVIS